MYSTLPLRSSKRESYGFLLVWSPLIRGAIVGRGHRWIDLDRCVIFRLSASSEVALPGFLTRGALGADRCVQGVFAVDSASESVCTGPLFDSLGLGRGGSGLRALFRRRRRWVFCPGTRWLDGRTCSNCHTVSLGHMGGNGPVGNGYCRHTSTGTRGTGGYGGRQSTGPWCSCPSAKSGGWSRL